MHTTAHHPTVPAHEVLRRDASLDARASLVQRLVTAAPHPADRAWTDVTAGMCSLLAWVEPMAILREIAHLSAPTHGEEVGPLAATA